MGSTCRSLLCHPFRTLMILMLAAGLAACGSDGKDGEQGPPGPEGLPGPGALKTMDSVAAEGGEVLAEITSVTMNSPMTIDFTLKDRDGVGVTGLAAGEVRFYIAKLLPGNTDPNVPYSEWVNYIVDVEDPTPGVGTGTECRYQADYERGDVGTFTDNGDGSYTYVTAIDITDSGANQPQPGDPNYCADDTQPDLSYQGALRHRVSLEVRSAVEDILNPIYDFVPDGGSLAGTASRDIVNYATCNNCHGILQFHGGARNNTSECVLCHNPGTTDANSENTVDFKVMVHKIHTGEDLNNLPYVIYGYRDREHDYSDVVFPQGGLLNCQACHDESDPTTPEASNWRNVPSIEACGSCHDNVSFEDPPPAGQVLHSAGAAENQDCLGCHGDSSGRPWGITDVHRDLVQEAAEEFVINIKDIDFSGGLGTAPTVTFSITDSAGTPYDLEELTPATAPNGLDLGTPEPVFGGMRLTLAWPTTDYHNDGTGAEPAQTARTSLFSGDVLQANDIGGGDYTIDLETVPATGPYLGAIAGSGTVTVEGHPLAMVDRTWKTVSPPNAERYTIEEIPAESQHASFSLDGSDVEDRRVKVSVDACNVCHDNSSLHGANRNNDIQVCVTCHNADATDVNRRLNADIHWGNVDPADDKGEESISLGRMIHKIHAANAVVYGFGLPPATGFTQHDFTELLYPQSPGNCRACHEGDTLYPVTMEDGIRAVTINTASGDAKPVDPDPTNDVKITPNTAICSACHVSAEAAAHMEGFGGSFNACQLEDGTMVTNAIPLDDAAWPDGCDSTTNPVTLVETCIVCHGEGNTADVAEVHPLIE